MFNLTCLALFSDMEKTGFKTEDFFNFWVITVIPYFVSSVSNSFTKFEAEINVDALCFQTSRWSQEAYFINTAINTN
jgi:hypothetical protein